MTELARRQDADCPQAGIPGRPRATFNAEKYPEITFKSTRIRKSGANGYKATGDLTLHGQTRPITLTIDVVGAGSDPWGGYRRGFETTFTIKRSDFGMNFMSGGLGDEVTLIAGLECIRK